MFSRMMFSVLVIVGAVLGGAIGSQFIGEAFAQPVRRVEVFSETHDFGNLVDGAGETGSISAVGSELGDSCTASVGVDIVDMTLTCYVQAANTIEYRLQNESGGAADLASTTVRVFLFRND